MKNLINSFISSSILILSNEIFHFLNMSELSFYIYDEINYFLELFILIMIISIFLFILSIFIGNRNIKFKNSYSIIIISFINFLIFSFIIKEIFFIKMSIQTILSLFLSTILFSYQFYYSIFYLDVVK